MKKCPVCGHENDDDMLFCHDCGEPLGEEVIAFAHRITGRVLFMQVKYEQKTR